MITVNQSNLLSVSEHEPSPKGEGGGRQTDLGGETVLEVSPPSPLAGILPYSEKYQLWSLPGHGSAYADCGSFGYRGCLNVDGHHDSALDDPGRGGKVFVQVYKRSCARKECPICYESWAGLEAERARYRLEKYGGKWKRPVHVVASPHVSLWIQDYRKLRSRLYVVLRRAGIRGGCVVFHPFRKGSGSTWRFSPHFHVLAYGWLNSYRDGGLWFLKNLGVRKSLHATLMYQLSHAGVHAEFHTTTWFGALAYNRLRIPPLVEEPHVCPLCGYELVPLVYVGDRGPPLKMWDFWLEPGDWRKKIVRFG